jgi:hypothetical protein
LATPFGIDRSFRLRKVDMKRFLAGLALLACSACSGGSSGSTPTTPSTPPLAPTSETFTGTVSVGGSDSHSFVVKLSNGLLTATLTATSPSSTVPMGLGIGTSSNGTCSLLSGGAVIATASTTAQLTGTNFASGTYCVQVFDVGSQSADVTYSVTVTHY